MAKTYLIKETVAVEYSVFVHADSEEEAHELIEDLSFDERYGETISLLNSDIQQVDSYERGFEHIPVVEKIEQRSIKHTNILPISNELVETK